ncbi:hypothetical protein [Kitasatospora sp. MBT66]|uniref:hypothetical protein n=1 Tax=Kitasatospora sp. MBT66 TaxID=1444769 RepID=UPI0005B77524|nr:hypothetical protein [Kitasatospora sp. MBT66]
MRNLTRSIVARLFRKNHQQSGKAVVPDNSYGVRPALDLISRDIEGGDYILNCREAEALGSLLWSFGHGEMAEQVISAHSEYDECGDAHHICGSDCSEDDEDPFELAV